LEEMKMKKAIALLLLAIIATGLFTGCSFGRGSDARYGASSDRTEAAGTASATNAPGEETPATPEAAETRTYGDMLEKKFAGRDMVAAADNLAGFNVSEVSYTDTEIKIAMEASNDIRKLAVFARTFIIDSEDYEKFDNSFSFTFHTNAGSSIEEPDAVGLEKDWAKEGLIVYFRGITAEESEEFASLPMFFTIELGDNPRVVSGPLFAGDMFDHVRLPED